jgi:hypothetical protein
MTVFGLIMSALRARVLPEEPRDRWSKDDYWFALWLGMFAWPVTGPIFLLGRFFKWFGEWSVRYEKSLKQKVIERRDAKLRALAEKREQELERKATERSSIPTRDYRTLGK